MHTTDVLPWAVGFLLVVNLTTFALYGLDKFKARHSRRRISEATLLGLAAAGGSVGAWVGMCVWRHKTRHRKFTFGVPALLLVQLAALVALSFV